MTTIPEQSPKRRALAAILKVPEDSITTTDPGKHVWRHGKTEYAVWIDPIHSEHLQSIGQSGGFYCYRCKIGVSLL